MHLTAAEARAMGLLPQDLVENFRLDAHGRGEIEPDGPAGLVAHSRVMRQLVALARRIADLTCTVLITGEVGVGKERFARLIHEESTHAGRPFVVVNATGAGEELLASELFGHAKGGAPGATRDRPGAFELANGGTLVLNDADELPRNVRKGLIAVLRSHRTVRLGEQLARPTDARLILTTTVERSAEGWQRDFDRADHLAELHVPPLRERKWEILPLARALLAHAASSRERPLARLTPEAAYRMLRHHWPGNVQELVAAVDHAIAVARGRWVEADDLPTPLRDAARTALITPESP